MAYMVMACVIRIVFVPRKVPHPNIIIFKEKMTNLEPEFSPYYSKKTFTPPDSKSRPHLQQKMTRLSQLYSDYSLLTTRSERIDYLKQLLQEKDVHGVMPAEPESDSEGSMENLGDVTQFGLTGALAQMANMTFLAGAPELIQEAEKQISHVRSAAGREPDAPLGEGDPDITCEVPVLPGCLQDFKPVLSPSVSNDGGETSGESPSTHQKDDQVTPDDNEHGTESEADIKAAMASRGRRSAVVVPRPSNTRKPSIGKRGNP